MTVKELCSTPYGIWYEVTGTYVGYSGDHIGCSTPYGIWYEVTLTLVEAAVCTFLVLNALRHLV